MSAADFEQRVRLAAFDRLRELAAATDDGVMSRADLLTSIEVGAERIPLVSPAGEGIWKPRQLSEPLSVLSSADPSAGVPRYGDQVVEGLQRYDYRTGGARKWYNRALAGLAESRTDLIYVVKLRPGEYTAAWPVQVVRNEPSTGFVLIDDSRPETVTSPEVATLGDQLLAADPRARYVTVPRAVRLHQQAFRREVLRAYQRTCAMCDLRRPELVEAAHIIPDSDARSRPVVTNGLALCVMHHAAFDRQLVGVDPRFQVHVRRDVLDDADGPMLRHGLQGLAGRTLQLPRQRRDRPDPEFLDARYEQFRRAEPG